VAQDARHSGSKVGCSNWFIYKVGLFYDFGLNMEKRDDWGRNLGLSNSNMLVLTKNSRGVPET